MKEIIFLCHQPKFWICVVLVAVLTLAATMWVAILRDEKRMGL